MGMMRHFFDGEMSMFPMMFPMFILFLFLAMMAVRALIFGQSGFGPMGRDHHKRRGRFHQGTFWEEEKDSSSSQEGKAQRQPARPQKVKQTPKPTPSPMQIHLDKAHVYQEQINALIKATANKNARARLQGLTAQVDAWVQAIEDLVKRIDRFQKNGVVQQDLVSVPKSIVALETRLANETDKATRLELERTLASRRKQLAALEQLQTTIRRAEINIESTLSSLGTIYSQVLATQSTNQVADYSRLSAEADEEVRVLQDHLEALAEVKLGAVAFS